MTLDKTEQEIDMEIRTPAEVKESFNTIDPDTPVTAQPIETAWMSISAEGSSHHAFVKTPVGESTHSDGTSLRLHGAGKVRFKLKAGVRTLIHSGWHEDSAAGSKLHFRYFDANDQTIDEFDRALGAPRYYFNSKIPLSADVWGLEVSFIHGSAGNSQCGLDNFFSLEPESTRFQTIVELAKIETSR
jgi:hypothetical protein